LRDFLKTNPNDKTADLYLNGLIVNTAGGIFMSILPYWFIISSESIAFAAQLLLVLVILCILSRNQNKSTATWYLIGFWITTAGFFGVSTMILATYLPAWFTLQYPFLLLSPALLMQFAYHFPYSLPEQRRERWIVRVISGMSVVIGTGLCVACFLIPASRRLYTFLAVFGRTCAALDALWAILIFLRRSLRTSSGGDNHAQASRAFVWVFLIPFGLCLWAVLDRVAFDIPSHTYHFVLNIGFLGFLFAFVMAYLNYTAERYTFMSKLILSTLVTVLTVIQLLGQFMISTYAHEYNARRQGDVQRIRLLFNDASSPDFHSPDLPPQIAFIISKPLNASTESSNYTPHLVRDPYFDLRFVQHKGTYASHVWQAGYDRQSVYPVYTFRHVDREYTVGFRMEPYQQYLNPRSILVMWTLLGSTAAIVLIFPMFFRVSLVKPLERLLTGVRQVNQGNLDITVPVQYQDEIGFLTRSFNTMVGSVKRADQLKDEFLANTSHELRTPLNGIIGIAESLIDGATGPLPRQTRKNLSMLVSSGCRLASLVNDILDFSKLKMHELEILRKPVNIRVVADIVLTLSETLLAGKAIDLKNDIPPDIPAVEGDEDRLQQILHNLVGNAIKFTESGTVTVSAKVLSGSAEILSKTGATGTPEVARGEEDPGKMPAIQDIVAISVSDTGVGISPDKFDTIFQSFEQGDASTVREYGGTGLGLAVTKQLVELHGGTIWVESDVGNGSTFTFTLPISAGIPEPIRDTQAQLARIRMTEEDETIFVEEEPAEARETYSILVVDDEPVNQQVLANQLALQHYKVTQAFNGMDALQMIEKGKTVDLILLDIMMPRMSGYEVAQKIRQHYLPSELPIIMLTAKNQVGDLVEGFSSGANDYLAKPFSKAELFARINTHLNLLKINTSYNRFVPYEYLRFLQKETILEVHLGDHISKEMAVMFSDIRSFTALSEAMTPQENFDFINAYFKRVSPVIRAHDGFIVKFLGDGMMAVFPNGVEDAVRASVEKLTKVAQYNLHRQQEGWQPIQVGIGIHVGHMMVGMVGETARMQGDAFSDNVNLTARLEGLTKYYGVSLIVSGDTIDKLPDLDQYHLRFLGKVQVKGKGNPISAYEIYDGDPADMIALKVQTRADFEEGLRLYYHREFAEAAVCFKHVLKTNPDDKTADLYLKRAAQFMVQGVSDDWDGVEALEYK
jgi:signal transduction histidine kinase/class 3 adenylate cyclase